MDGVLLNSTGIHEKAFQAVLRPFGVTFCYADYAGMRTKETISSILASHGITVCPEELDELARRKSALALSRIEGENPIAPTAKTLLQHLYGRYALALASSASQASVDAFLDGNGLREYFGSVLAGGAVRHPKPAPDIYKKAMAELEIDEEQCLVVEDAVAGVQAAKAAGAIACGVLGTSSRERLVAAGADFVIEDLQELRSL